MYKGMKVTIVKKGKAPYIQHSYTALADTQFLALSKTTNTYYICVGINYFAILRRVAISFSKLEAFSLAFLADSSADFA